MYTTPSIRRVLSARCATRVACLGGPRSSVRAAARRNEVPHIERPRGVNGEHLVLSREIVGEFLAGTSQCPLPRLVRQASPGYRRVSSGIIGRAGERAAANRAIGHAREDEQQIR